MRALETARAVIHTLLALALLAFGSSPAWAHEGGLGNDVMWQACESRSVNDRCSFQNADHDTFRGTCQSVADRMVCVRNQPIARASPVDHAHAHADPPQSRAGNRWYGRVIGGFGLQPMPAQPAQ